jgi:peroxiredoxin family protein
MSRVGRPRRQVDRGLRVGREHDQHRAGRQPGDRPLGQGERQGACEATGVQRGHNAIVAEPDYSLAAVIATDDPPRMYSALSLVVSAAAEGARCAVLLSFRGLELFSSAELERRAEDSGDRLLSPAGRDTFARSLAELRDTVLALDTVDVHVCAATAETTLIESDLPVMSTPRFLRATAGARLLFA